ncbi:MAG: bifunctional riboflavin kinase/FAD synthetase [Actinomycetota bacterium]|nr:bifunctional riboflavin kinase/FAD synthetase [Actinomycetota bacterium]
MQLLSSGNLDSIDRPSVLTIGTFDGLHIGHMALINRARQIASERGFVSVAVTFNPHPAAVIRPEHAPLLINSFEERLELLEKSGIDYCYVVEFDKAAASEEALDFVKTTLVDRLIAKAIVVGVDFRFGKDRKGSVELLQRAGEEFDFVVESDPLVKIEGDQLTQICQAIQDNSGCSSLVSSSTVIRKLVSRGRVDLAKELLRREFFITGLVESGDGRGGSELGYPTANVSYGSDRALPLDGIYAGSVEVDGVTYRSAISVGTRPTYYPGGGSRLIEAFILDFSGDLYNKRVRVNFASFIRDQIAFESSQELIEQIEKDVKVVVGSITLGS